MERLSTVASLLAVLVCAPLVHGEADAPQARIAVVVGRQSVLDAVSKDALRDVYLRRQRVWSDGTRAVPVNLPAGNPIRERFSRTVLGRSTQQLVAYWNARYFEGIMPPAVLPSAAAIRAYLNAEPGSIAYLAEDDVDTSCRTLLWLDTREP